MTITPAITEEFKTALDTAARRIREVSSGEEVITVPGTKLKLYLVPAESDKAQQLNKKPGIFLGIEHELDGRKYLVFRTNKAILSS